MHELKQGGGVREAAALRGSEVRDIVTFLFMNPQLNTLP